MAKRIRRENNLRSNFVTSWKDNDSTILERIASIFNFHPNNNIDKNNKNDSSKFTSSTGARNHTSSNDIIR